MEAVLHTLAQIIIAVFVIGVAGCAIAIPVIAYRFISVLFEKDKEEEKKPPAQEQAQDSLNA
ncbi:MAG: hypothetical protein ACE14L_05540 [Terriglobales bacterium]